MNFFEGSSNPKKGKAILSFEPKGEQELIIWEYQFYDYENYWSLWKAVFSNKGY